MDYREDKPSGLDWEELKEIVKCLQDTIDSIEAGKNGDDFKDRFDEIMDCVDDLYIVAYNALFQESR